ncbi:MAG: hypothetical protein KME06_09655 [Kastovskya adunca ATA6-11-RM4]|nr:hypothetical protein [Kastovskya adunca ATA6-11-RM4]
MNLLVKALGVAATGVVGSAVAMQLLVLPALEKSVSEERMMAIAYQIGTGAGLASAATLLVAEFLGKRKIPTTPEEAILMQLQRSEIEPEQAARLSEAYAALSGQNRLGS